MVVDEEMSGVQIHVLHGKVMLFSQKLSVLIDCRKEGCASSLSPLMKKSSKTMIPQCEQVENSALKETFLLIYSCILMLLLPSPCKEWSAALLWEGKIVMALCEKQ